MQEKYYFENLLNTSKSLTGLLYQATVEASTDDVRATFNTLLFDVLEWQNAIFKHMEQMGYYKQENVEQQEINQEKANVQPLNIEYPTPCR